MFRFALITTDGEVYGHLMENALSDAATLYDPLRDVAGVAAG